MKQLSIWLLAAVASVLIGFYLRAILPMAHVFTVEGVNFQETDAWYHARLVEAFLEGIPAATMLDPYGSFPSPQRVDVGPVLDSLLAVAIRLTGLDIHTAAAWCPVFLWLLLLAVIGLLAKQVFGPTQACIAIIIAALLPGNYMRVTSLGYHDHHVLEALLFTGVLLLLTKQWHWAAGFALALYLLTFLGGAVFVAFLIFWRLLTPTAPTLWPTYLLAILVLVPFRQMLWMEYSIASLAAALALEVFFLFVQKPLWRWGTILIATLLCLFAAQHFGVFHLAKHFATSSGASTIGEMRWLNLDLIWSHFGPMVAFGLAGAWQLARSREPNHRLLVTVSLAFAFIGIFQLRLSYYLAIGLALLASFALVEFFNSLTSHRIRTIATPVLMACLLAPNLLFAYKHQSSNYGVRIDWLDAMRWMRWNTPEPFGDANAFTRLQPLAPFQFPPTAYGVFAWWDHGYTIETIAHRIPFTNPTQRNAREAATIFLAKSEADFVSALRQQRQQYVVLGDDLAMLPRGSVILGKIPSLAKWANQDANSFFETLSFTDELGKTSALTVYYPAYYRLPAVRLTLHGTEEYVPTSGICVLTREGKNAKNLKCFNTEAEATVALQSPNTVLVGVKPLETCVRLEAWSQLETVYRSREKVARIGDKLVHSLQIFHLKPAP
jgi:asparagine N-glycosylation enzyme membrane subunit Stt3